MASSCGSVLTHGWKLLSGRKLVALSFLALCTSLLIVYWAAFELGYTPFLWRSHDGQTSSFFPRVETLNQHVSVEEKVLRAVNKLPFRIMTPSALLLEDLYFIPNPHKHAHYNTSVLHQPEAGCGPSDVFLLMLVPSPPDSSPTRKAIRETWGSVARGSHWPWRGGGYQVKLIFVLGVPRSVGHEEKLQTNQRTSSEPLQPLIKPGSDMNTDEGLGSDKDTSNNHPEREDYDEEHYIQEDYEESEVKISDQIEDILETYTQDDNDEAERQEPEYSERQTHPNHRLRRAVSRQAEQAGVGHLRGPKEDFEELSSLNKTSTWPVRSAQIARSRSNMDKISLALEAASSQDILQVDMVDSYTNLTQKIILALQWAVTSCPSVKYILKVDQDVFVNVPLLTTFLRLHGETNSIYGHIYANAWVERKGKWAVSSKALPIPKYPIYAAGNAYILSKDAAVKILELAPRFPYIPVEDAFLTGILASVAGVDRVNVAGFTRWTEPVPDSCDFVNDRRYVGNNLTNFDHRTIWRTLLDRGNGLCDR